MRSAGSKHHYPKVMCWKYWQRGLCPWSDRLHDDLAEGKPVLNRLLHRCQRSILEDDDLARVVQVTSCAVFIWGEKVVRFADRHLHNNSQNALGLISGWLVAGSAQKVPHLQRHSGFQIRPEGDIPPDLGGWSDLTGQCQSPRSFEGIPGWRRWTFDTGAKVIN
jgi:hypothetical protein